MDWVSLPHPIRGSRSLFSCLYTILCHHEPLPKHVQHTFPVTPWPIIYSCVNTVLRANRRYSRILVHSCVYLHTKGVGLVTKPPDCKGFTLLHMQNLHLPDRPNASANRSGAWQSVPWGSRTPRGGVRTVTIAYRTSLSHVAKAFLGVIQRTSACFMPTGSLRYREKGENHGKSCTHVDTRQGGGRRVVSAAGIDLMMRRTTS